MLSQLSSLHGTYLIFSLFILLFFGFRFIHLNYLKTYNLPLKSKIVLNILLVRIILNLVNIFFKKIQFSCPQNLVIMIFVYKIKLTHWIPKKIYLILCDMCWALTYNFHWYKTRWWFNISRIVPCVSLVFLWINCEYIIQIILPCAEAWPIFFTSSCELQFF